MVQEGDQQLDDFSYSLGLKIASEGGSINEVLWESPAFRAGLAKDMQVVAIDGMAYNADRLKRTLVAAQSSKVPLMTMSMGLMRVESGLVSKRR